MSDLLSSFIEETLVQLGITAIEPFILALQAHDGRMRDTAEEVLGRIGSDQIIDPLKARISSTTMPIERCAAAEAQAVGLLKPLSTSIVCLIANAQVSHRGTPQL